LFFLQIFSPGECAGSLEPPGFFDYLGRYGPGMKKNRPGWAILTFLLASLLPSPGFSRENASGQDYVQTFLQGGASNFLIWGFDYVVLQAGYAQISPKTWRDNLREGFQWDNSEFHTNQILHPYQGSSYYNAARVNGFSFWGSVPFTVFGSLVWEFFGERENASLNDVITTGFGGVAMGEMGHRLSAALVRGRSDGAGRVAREAVALLVNPVLTFNRLIYGDRVLYRLPGRTPPVDLEFHSGINGTWERRAFTIAFPHPFIGIGLRYGDPFGAAGDLRAPYDYFRLRVGLYGDVDNPGSDVFAHGLLWGRRLYPGREGRALAGVFQHFDYMDNYKFKFAANGVGGGIETSFPLDGERELGFLLHLFGVALGGVDSRYSRGLTGRDYSLGPGAGMKSELRCSFPAGRSLALAYSYYWFFTLSGSDRENGAGFLSGQGEAAVTDTTRLGLEFRLYHRWSDAGFDDALSFGLRTYLSFSL